MLVIIEVFFLTLFQPSFCWQIIKLKTVFKKGSDN